MDTMIFIAVIIVFVFILVNKRSQELKEKEAGTVLALPSPTPEYDEYIRILAFNPKESKDAYAFGVSIEEGLSETLSRYLCSGYTCRVEFITVGLCLVAVIRIKTTAGKKKRGIGSIWKGQSAETIFRR